MSTRIRQDQGNGVHKRVVFSVALAVLGAAALVGCGETPQSVDYKGGKYRGKQDSRPWDNAPPAAGTSAWNKGDHGTWENQVRSRTAAQNENRRIGH